MQSIIEQIRNGVGTASTIIKGVKCLQLLFHVSLIHRRCSRVSMWTCVRENRGFRSKNWNYDTIVVLRSTSILKI